jgi:hypothetical protein
MRAVQEEDNKRKQLFRFKRTSHSRSTDAPKKKPFFPYIKKGLQKGTKRSICNTKIDECDEEEKIKGDEQEDDQEDEEYLVVEEIDLCIAGSEQGICSNYGELGHFSQECKKPRKKFSKKPEGPKTFKLGKTTFARFKHIDMVAKDLQNLSTEEWEFFIKVLNKEGF